MRLTSIDIGTNTILLLIADFDVAKNNIYPVIDIQRIPRLGKSVDENRNIHPESIVKAIHVLNKFKEISNRYGSKKIIATATSFIRDANNKKEFLDSVKDKTEIEIEILSGEDEARWTFWGGVFDKLKVQCSKFKVSLIDIGGGSTEISAADIKNDLPLAKQIQETTIRGKSIDIGSVRIKEKFFHNHPPTNNDIHKAEEFIQSQFDKSYKSYKSYNLTGVAGTITTLGAIKLKLPAFDHNKVDGIPLSLNEVKKMIHYFVNTPLHDLYSLGDYMEGRADIILSGTLILKCFMEKFGFEGLAVSTNGLRYGIFLREVLK